MQSQKGSPRLAGASQCNRNYNPLRPLGLDDFNFIKLSDYESAYILEDVMLIPIFGGFAVTLNDKRVSQKPLSTDEALELATELLVKEDQPKEIEDDQDDWVDARQEERAYEAFLFQDAEERI
jgi:hypothetical protein